jgi:hypothetical protein
MMAQIVPARPASTIVPGSSRLASLIVPGTGFTNRPAPRSNRFGCFGLHLGFHGTHVAESVRIAD